MDLVWGHEHESALERLADVFRIGVRGQVFRDYLKSGRQRGMTEAEIMTEWRAFEKATAWAAQRVK